MKRFIATAVAAVLGLWLGYFLGYRHGVREERGAWEATRVASLVAVTNNGYVTKATRISYADPNHPLYAVAGPKGRGARGSRNGPDPRTYRQYER
jgi:hypothetical protein